VDKDEKTKPHNYILIGWTAQLTSWVKNSFTFSTQTIWIHEFRRGLKIIGRYN